MRVHLRPATDADAESIAALLTHLGYPTESGAVPRRLDRMAGPSNTVLLAVDGSTAPLGLVAVHMMHALHANEPVAMIMALVVSPNARGMGVGRELVRAAERWAVARGCERLMVTSAEHRDDAHAFYPACGMAYTGRRFAKTLSVPDGSS